MAKLWNKLYPNPQNAKPHEAGAEIRFGQAIRVGDKKFASDAIYYPESLYLRMSAKAEDKAIDLRKKLLDEVNRAKQDMPWVNGKKYDLFLEYSVSTIVYSYTAIETFVDLYIEAASTPDKKQEYLNLDLARKIGEILPALTSKGKLPEEIWNKFHEIDEIRHMIIHTNSRKYWVDNDSWSTTIPYKFFNGIFEGCTKTAQEIIEYFKPKIVNAGPVTFHNVQRGMGSRPIQNNK